MLVILGLVWHLQWWLDVSNLREGFVLQPSPPSVTVTTDASLEGWGGYLHGSQEFRVLSQGTWSLEERKLHFNVFELWAVRLIFRLQS